jgi:integrase
LPFDRVGIPKTDFTKPPPFYDEDEMNRVILAAMNDVERSALPLVLTGFDAGLRDGELRGLAPYDVKWGLKQIRVERQVWGIDNVGKPKSGYGRTIDVPDRLLAVVKERATLKGDRLFLRNDGKPWTPKTIRRLMKRLQEAAGLEPKGGIHILRHTFCTRLASNRIDIRVIKEMAGHTDVKTTMRYLHIVKGATAAAAATLNTPLPNPEPPDSGAATQPVV